MFLTIIVYGLTRYYLYRVFSLKLKVCVDLASVLAKFFLLSKLKKPANSSSFERINEVHGRSTVDPWSVFTPGFKQL